MTKIKSFICLILTAFLLALSFGLIGCGRSSFPDYYNTTYTLTGRALKPDQDMKNMQDNGYKQLSSQDARLETNMENSSCISYYARPEVEITKN